MPHIRLLRIFTLGIIVATLTSSCYSGIYLYNSSDTITTKKIAVDTVLINKGGEIAVTFRGVNDGSCLVASESDAIGFMKWWKQARSHHKPEPKILAINLNLTGFAHGEAATAALYRAWRVKPYPPWPPSQSTIIRNTSKESPIKFTYSTDSISYDLSLEGYIRKGRWWAPFRLIPLIVTVPLDIITSPFQLGYFLFNYF